MLRGCNEGVFMGVTRVCGGCVVGCRGCVVGCVEDV